jgi:hypothetical protein
MYMALKKQDRSNGVGTRVQYGIYPPPSMTQGYVSYWLKLQPNLATEILPPGTRSSRQVMELKESGSEVGDDADFRWNISIYRTRDNPNLMWGAQAQFGGGNMPVAWEYKSTAVPVPVGTWFKFEVFWKSGITDGRIWGAVDGRVFIDRVGQTQKDSSVYVWWPMKVYVGSNLGSFGGKHIYQWVDDMVVRYDRP